MYHHPSGCTCTCRAFTCTCAAQRSAACCDTRARSPRSGHRGVSPSARADCALCSVVPARPLLELPNVDFES
eukprot:7190305-Prymnesium_polylepis.1